MFEQYKNKIELHCHSSAISKCSDISAPDLIKYYREEKYQGLVITNHFFPWIPKNQKAYEKYVEEYIEEYHVLKELGERMAMAVYLGMEIRFPENMNDYLLYGIDEDFIRAIPRNCETLEEFSDFLKDYPQVIIIQAHPFRNAMIMKDSDLLDGMEIYNVHPNHNARIGLAAKYAELEKLKICTCGTDFHHVGQQALSALLTREIPKDGKELVDCIKNDQIYKIGKSIVCFNNIE